MPFTLAHPAAVVYLKNTRFNFTALILGSMAPDFLYFINFRPYGHFGHEFLGMFLLNLPLCFLLAYLFHNVIKSNLISHLPRPFDSWYGYLRTEKFMIHSWNDVWVFTYSSLFGMITHILWDGFTHSNGFFVSHISYLSRKVFLMGNHEVYVYKIIQHGSTIIGGIIVLIALYMLRDKRKRILWGHKKFYEKLIYDLIVLGVIGFTILISYFIFLKLNVTYGIGTLVISIINGFFIGVLILGFFKER